jgi:glutathione S-transferase
MSRDETPRYELYYWPSLQGRGELVRLAFEATGTPYVDVARLPEDQGGGVAAVRRALDGRAGALRPFAPPVLRVGDLVLAQAANILAYLGPRLGLAPDDDAGRAAALQLQLTLADLVAEVHDTHHPIGASLYYEDQVAEAKRRAQLFVAQRLPKFLAYFEVVLAENTAGRGEHLVGDRLSYPDLSMFQVLEGLAYAFPHALGRLLPTIPRLAALRDRVAGEERVAAYLASPRRIPFNERGIFRRYPELDAGPLEDRA